MRLSGLQTSLYPLLTLASLISLTSSQAHSSNTFQWTPCTLPESAAIPPSLQVTTECSTISVPSDYTLSNSSTIPLRLVRVPASQPTNSRKSILLNFGGPGETGFDYLAAYGRRILAMTGGTFDLVLIAPRGTVPETLPFACYESEEIRQKDGLVRRIFAGMASDVALGDMWANAGALAEICVRNMGERGELISSTCTARDFMQVVDALGEDGFSYGTFLGQVLAAMFPEKVESMLLDGVINGHENQAGFDIEAVSEADKVFQGFCAACVENAEQCVAARAYSAQQLEEAVYTAFERIKARPLPSFVEGYGDFVLDYTNARFIVYFAMYAPSSWPSLATFLDAFIRDDRAGLDAYVQNFVGNGGLTALVNPAVETLLGIRCSDRTADAATHLAEVQDKLEAHMENSRIGGDVAVFVNAQCAQWKMPGKERYAGDFRVQTKNPVLIVGNRADPITPFASARNASTSLLGSVLLQHGSFGHTTLMSKASLCTAQAVRAYFEGDQLPQPNTVCQADVPDYGSDDGWEAVIDSLNGRSSTKRSDTNDCNVGSLKADFGVI